MGQAFDRDGNVLGEAFGQTKREVFDKLTADFKNAHEIRIKSLEESVAAAEMPRYRCHKEVWAIKIQAIDEVGPDGACKLFPADAGYAGFLVDGAYVRKHNPQPGGYYVVYKDGYKSFSPADAFEDGYARI